SPVEVRYPFELLGHLRTRDSNKLGPDETVHVCVLLSRGQYCVRVENHDTLSAPPLALHIQLVNVRWVTPARLPPSAESGADGSFVDSVSPPASTEVVAQGSAPASSSSVPSSLDMTNTPLSPP